MSMYFMEKSNCLVFTNLNYLPDQSPIQPNSEISSEDCSVLSSNADEITIDEQKIDPLGECGRFE